MAAVSAARAAASAFRKRSLSTRISVSLMRSVRTPGAATCALTQASSRSVRCSRSTVSMTDNPSLIGWTLSKLGMATSMADDEKDRKQDNTPGAEGGDASDNKDTPPAVPADDDSPLGDTDQHSNADA